jgi:hypothetical protein
MMDAVQLCWHLNVLVVITILLFEFASESCLSLLSYDHLIHLFSILSSKPYHASSLFMFRSMSDFMSVLKSRSIHGFWDNGFL